MVWAVIDNQVPTIVNSSVPCTSPISPWTELLSSCATSQTEVPKGLTGVPIMGLQPGDGRGRRASITAQGYVMSRWPGATQEPAPSSNNPSFHPRSTLALQTSWSHWVDQAERRDAGGVGRELFYWQDLNLPFVLVEVICSSFTILI